MFSLDLLLEVIMEAFYENMRKRILQKVNISANSNCWIWAGGLDPKKKMAELGMSTQSLGIPRGRMSVAWLTWFFTRYGVQILD